MPKPLRKLETSPRERTPAVRILPEDVANKIAAGEVVERPASVVKELVENALDAGATRITVRVIAAGRRLIEVIDNGHGMSEQNALLAIERHATSKIRTAEDLEAVRTMGFRGEALASIASVSRFVLVTRRAKDTEATRISVDGGTLRPVEKTAAPPGTRVSVNRLYFNTPVRAKFLKGITTELGHCIDVVQRHAFAREGVGFQFFHNDKLLLDVPEQASLRERVALIWGLHVAEDMVAVAGEQAGFRIRGVAGRPGLTRAARSHQYFFMNHRPVVNRTLQYGFEEGYRGLVTVGRYPVGILLIETHPRFVDVNIHPTKREIRFRDERVVRDAVRDVVRASLERAEAMLARHVPQRTTVTVSSASASFAAQPEEEDSDKPVGLATDAPDSGATEALPPAAVPPRVEDLDTSAIAQPAAPPRSEARIILPQQTEIPGVTPLDQLDAIAPAPVYEPVGRLEEAPLQVFDTYLLVPGEDRLLIIDQHALHERLNYDALVNELQDNQYTAQQLAVPIVIEVAPAQVRLLESNLDLFRQVGIELEPFGGTAFQVTAVCHLYDEALVRDVIFRILDELAQGDLFDRGNLLSDVLRLATRACKASIRAGDRLSPQERRGLLEGFRRLRPPYTCPHGRPIIVELTQHQMEKSFKRIQ